ncbi:MAG: serine protease [Flavobacteriaceae bacterium]|jgi:hypothetical protein|nr:serine protease [Flavobacteriaceae bacterium]
MDLFNQLELDQKIYWCIAIFSTLVFIVQAVLTFIGTDAFDGTQADFDGGDLSGGGEPFQLFSFRNLINFLLGFSWTGISFSGIISNRILLMALAVFVGILFIAMFFIILRQLMKLAEDNSFRIEDTLNQVAEVYIPIPENKKGKGKISISIRGSVREIDSISKNERIETGAPVRVIKIESPNLVLVEKI